MDLSSAHHHQQEMCSETLESILVCTNSQQEKKARPAEEAMKCPRCDSINTKFCYYNNYSLTQPRYFCKSCRRYWTKGGTLRNVPVGGACRKNKRSSSSSSKRIIQENPTLLTTNHSNPFLTSLSQTLLPYDYSSDLSLAFARLQQKQHNGQICHFDDHEFSCGNNGMFDALKCGFLETPDGFQHNFYSGNMRNNQGQIGHFGNGGLVINNNAGEAFAETGGMAYENARTGIISSVKQEGDQNNNKILWGFPWQINGGDNANMATTDLDYVGKQSWNGFSSTWQGLINSPLI